MTPARRTCRWRPEQTRRASAKCAHARQGDRRAADGDQRRAVPAQLGHRATVDDPRHMVQVRRSCIPASGTNTSTRRRKVALGASHRVTGTTSPCTMRPTARPSKCATRQSSPNDPRAHRRSPDTGGFPPHRPAPPPELAGSTGSTLATGSPSSTRSCEHRVGLIVRVNQIATLDCDGQKSRVAFELLRPLVDI